MSVSLSLLWSDAAVAGMFMGPLSIGGIAWYWGYKVQRSGRRNPLARNLLRSLYVLLSLPQPAPADDHAAAREKVLATLQQIRR